MRFLAIAFVPLLACGSGQPKQTSSPSDSAWKPVPGGQELADACKDKISAKATMNLTTQANDHVVVEFTSKPSDAELGNLGLTAFDETTARGLLTREQVIAVCKATGVKWVEHETQGTEFKPS